MDFLSAISVGIIYKFWSPNTYNKKISKLKNNYNQNNYFKEQDSNSFITFRNFGEILGNSIKSSIQSILQIGGFIVIFSVIFSIFCQVLIQYFQCQIIFLKVYFLEYLNLLME